jgi:putative PIN family toxin of toxin-antitoxin system
MKVFFDSNVYIAEAILGEGARRIIRATQRAKWRVYTCDYLVDEVAHVLSDEFGFSRKLAVLAQQRIIRRAVMVRKTVRAEVPMDPKDNPILQAALACGADYLVSNDRHLLSLNPFQGLRILSMSEYFDILRTAGLLK